MPGEKSRSLRLHLLKDSRDYQGGRGFDDHYRDKEGVLFQRGVGLDHGRGREEMPNSCTDRSLLRVSWSSSAKTFYQKLPTVR